MLLRRLFEHFRTQNWIAIGLDLIVVVVGIFLGFQVDRWYDQIRLESEQQRYLLALADDFASSRASIEVVIERHEESVESAIRLLEYQLGEPVSLTHDEFYTAFGDIQLIRTADVRRSSYDFLLSSGSIAAIGDERLLRKMSEFFARIDGVTAAMSADLRSFWRGTFEPYLKLNLDHVSLMQKVHARDNMDLSPTLPLDQFHEVLGTGEFEAVVSDKWHLSSDLVVNYRERLREVVEIEALISENLASLEHAR